jgi:hypothetical protein
MTIRSAIVVLALASLLPAYPALAQSQSASPRAALLGTRMHEGLTLERLLAALKADFRQMALQGGDSLNPADVQMQETIAAAALHALSAGQTMRMDIDGDGFIVEEEVRTVLKYERGRAVAEMNVDFDDYLKKAIPPEMAMDTNGDGRIEWMEARAMPCSWRSIPLATAACS